MHGLSVFQRDHVQILPQFRGENPVADAPIRLDIAVWRFV